MRNSTRRGHAPARVMLGIAVVALTGTGLRLESAAQPTARLSALIEQLELGEPAISDVHWAFIDMEHGPYLLDQLQDRLAEFKPDGSPRPEPTPIVRIPIEGSQDPQFAVKQVLDSGAFGIVFPRVETADQARRAITSMRYPPQRGATNPEPHGRRGYGPFRAARYWGLQGPEYIRRADLWPLNPDGELFAMIMIESGLAVENIDEILQVPGIGAVFIGTSDLGMALGVGPPSPANAPEAEAAVQTVFRSCRRHNVICAYVLGRDDLDTRISQGAGMFLGGAPRR